MNLKAILSRQTLLFALLALIGAALIARVLTQSPGYTDAYYQFNAASRLVAGDGFSDAYLWTYLGAPPELPAPSHRYWMPLSALLAAAGMRLLNAPGDFAAAQAPFVLLLAAVATFTFVLGRSLTSGARPAWAAGLLVLLGGFYMRFWTTTDAFAPYALVGALCLWLIGLGLSPDLRYRWLVWALAGICAGLGHLARADGLLLVLVGWLAALPIVRRSPRRGLGGLIIFSLTYLLVMLPWLLRMQSVTGAPLPVGGLGSIVFTSYDDLFNYPPGASLSDFLAQGWAVIVRTRIDALAAGLGTLIAVEGLVVLAPFMLLGLWKRRGWPVLRPFWLYALALHLVMTLVFAYPGMRGGLFHSAAALMPFWMVLGIAGLDDAIDWAAARRPDWHAPSAKVVFTLVLAVIALLISLSVSLPRRFTTGTPALYSELKSWLPSDAVVMVNDPAQLTYYAGLSGVVIPNASPDRIPAIADQYHVTHLLLEGVTGPGRAVVPLRFAFDPDDPPEFLRLIPLMTPGARLYAIEP